MALLTIVGRYIVNCLTDRILGRRSAVFRRAWSRGHTEESRIATKVYQKYEKASKGYKMKKNFIEKRRVSFWNIYQCGVGGRKAGYH